ncbi:High mobility group B protein 9 [Forsythia ovata]|uniref:High mobility group B protein 9 n=1 Tax=Forsythia ovata TaxID=205694 RepID=A0ABD1PW75_9LAMI
MSETYSQNLESTPSLSRYQRIRVNSKGMTGGCKWLEMLKDVRVVVFCIALSEKMPLGCCGSDDGRVPCSGGQDWKNEPHSPFQDVTSIQPIHEQVSDLSSCPSQTEPINNPCGDHLTPNILSKRSSRLKTTPAWLKDFVTNFAVSTPATIPSGNGVQGYPFPVPLATHEDVVRDPALFFSTIRTFHSATGTKFMYVVTDKKWREISGIFNFSPTTTSASYALRKHYSGLLLGFEQAYFFRHHPTGLSTFQAIGTIEGKFDCGYLISVKLGEEILSGVLYHPGNPGSSAATQYGNTVIPYIPQLLDQNGKGRRRRRRRRWGGDPDRPKPNRSGYNFFFAEKHSMLKSLYPNREREFTKMIGESWNKLTSEERMVYQSHGLKDKERYQKEMEEYKERIKIE